MDQAKKDRIREILDINDDGVVDVKDYLIFAGVMIAGYFLITRAKRLFKKG